MRSRIHLRCRNCTHTFQPLKRKKRYQCRLCGRKGAVGGSRDDLFQKYTSKDFKVLLDLFNKEPYDLEALKIAQEIKEARKRGETVGTTNRIRKPEPAKPKKIPGRQKKDLRPGTIEHFHTKYRHFKEQHPNQEPRAHKVSEWLRDGKMSKKVCDRWALELLEKHKPELSRKRP